MHRNLLGKTLLLLFLVGASADCSSRAQVLCELVCDCRHCSDHGEITMCAEYSRQEDMADAYGCSDAWLAFTICVEEKGTCDETMAEFSAIENGIKDRCAAERLGLHNCILAASAHGGFRIE
ncbi:hypothetical protein [Polyangium sorediatum]|uniref:Uncharacterized protein n=1 Tax=Polyangium sorediatum TaxID=889274 RepID=A0ABT6P851_9BACT|nr:hypothetical protein [Polyangium sorediatum]MDI1436741.1 hypothetical protein [Polyangium sorediatum]